MEDNYKKTANIVNLDIKNDNDIPYMVKLCNALGSEVRMKILKTLQRRPYTFSITDLIKLTNIPCTTLIHHLNILKEVNLIDITYKSTKHGSTRIISRYLKGASLNFYYLEDKDNTTIKTELQNMKVGNFIKYEGNDFNFVTPTRSYPKRGTDCYIPERFQAELIYTLNGKLTYIFSNNAAKFNKIKSISFSMELSSETPYYDNDYLSEITFWINDIEIATYLSLGDYGDRRGILNPAWWPDRNSQYGKLVTVLVDEAGVSLNGKQISTKINISKLNIQKGNSIIFALGNKQTSTYIGGFNLFGSSFGDFHQDILCAISYYDEKRAN